jgi:acyl-coenzyme A thioesterase PaaI-like protein
MIPRFADVMALAEVDAGPGPARVFGAHLDEHWTIGPKVHGGVMVALCAAAARRAYAGDGAGYAQPVAVCVDFLAAPDPGPVRLVTTVRKRGRRIGLADVELVAGERACVRAAVTLGGLGSHAAPLLSAHQVTRLMPAEPPAGVAVIGPGHPGAEINNLARGCEIHPLTGEVPDGGAPLYRIWVRPRGEPVDELFALMAGDISVPVSYAVGRRGWAPTVQLTAYLRALPADGWLRVLCTTTEIGGDWFDADHTVVDSAGHLVVQTRQLALLPGE